MPGWAVVGVVAAVVLVAAACVMLLLSLRRERARTAAALARAEADAAELRTQLSGIEQRLAAPRAAAQEREYVITRLGEDEPTPGRSVATPAPVVPAPVFADLVLRETAVQTGAFVAGLRRAFSPEVRHRIRFEMRREVKRARKQRKAEHRVAVREWQARQRAGIDLDESAA